MGIAHHISCFTVLNVVIVLCTSTWPCFCWNSTMLCIEEERVALLEFKRSLQSDPPALLQSWEMKDCCNWSGVACDPSSGHVAKLELLPLPSSDKPFSASELSPSISKLTCLTYLDLSGFEIITSTLFPKFIGSMKQLKHLNLSEVSFHGIIPSLLGNLTGLERLDMSKVELAEAHDLIKVLGVLPSLTHLALSSSGIGNSHLSHVGALLNTSSFANLQYLDLSLNKFQGPVPSRLLQNMSSLNYLDLSGNSFSSIGSSFLLNPDLLHLDMSSNQFQGELPTLLQNLTSLTYLDLSNNSFTSIPEWFTDLKSLVHLDLGFNFLNQSEGGFFTLLLQGKCDLRYLKLNNNSLIGEMSSGSSTGFCAFNLESIDASFNSFEGELPDWLWNLTDLTFLSLRSNRLLGNISESLGQLQSLQWLDLSDNSLKGIVSEVHLTNLSRLSGLYLSNNSLTIRLPEDWIPPFQLSEIAMDSGKFGGEFPKWIRTQRRLVSISLSEASILGDIPGWLVTEMKLEYLRLAHNNITGPIPQFLSSLYHLDLSHNNITGPIPELPSSLYFLDLSDNKISGTIPTLPSNLVSLELSENQISGLIPQNIGEELPFLVYLFLYENLLSGPIPLSLCGLALFEIDLSNNKLSGHIPDCWNSTSLNFISLSSNNISGHVPDSIGKLTNLSSLHLNNNSLQGEFPVALRKLKSLVVLDLGENHFTGHLPEWKGDRLQILRLRHNRFSGGIPQRLCHILPNLQILDLAENNLEGTIPACFSNISNMTRVANTCNADDKKEPDNGGTDWDDERLMEVFQGIQKEYSSKPLILTIALDLSSNNLSGTIPEGMTVLRYMNLSYNRLSGNIPKKVGEMKCLESLDVSNNQLSGTIPQGIAALSSLHKLNLSNNNLSGLIPGGKQLDTFNRSIYAGNPLLCGLILLKRCYKVAEPPENSGKKEEGDNSDEVIKYGVIALGFMTGFWGVVVTLVFKKKWRAAYFGFAEDIADRASVSVMMSIAEIKRRMSQEQLNQ